MEKKDTKFWSNISNNILGEVQKIIEPFIGTG